MEPMEENIYPAPTEPDPGMSEYAGGKKCILNYLDWLLTMTRLTKWEEDWLLTLKNALTAI